MFNAIELRLFDATELRVFDATEFLNEPRGRGERNYLMDEPRDRDERRFPNTTKVLEETSGMQNGDFLAHQKSWTRQEAETSGDSLTQYSSWTRQEACRAAIS